jgi:hypothetical protein
MAGKLADLYMAYGEDAVKTPEWDIVEQHLLDAIDMFEYRVRLDTDIDWGQSYKSGNV